MLTIQNLLYFLSKPVIMALSSVLYQIMPLCFFPDLSGCFCTMDLISVLDFACRLAWFSLVCPIVKKTGVVASTMQQSWHNKAIHPSLFGKRLKCFFHFGKKIKSYITLKEQCASGRASITTLPHPNGNNNHPPLTIYDNKLLVLSHI